jgi:hypothetical protein
MMYTIWYKQILMTQTKKITPKKQIKKAVQKPVATKTVTKKVVAKKPTKKVAVVKVKKPTTKKTTSKPVAKKVVRVKALAAKPKSTIVVQKPAKKAQKKVKKTVVVEPQPIDMEKEVTNPIAYLLRLDVLIALSLFFLLVTNIISFTVIQNNNDVQNERLDMIESTIYEQQ